jgi:outer membrane autotransporter protein
VKNADGSTARVDGPGVGLYTIYANGGFSTDATFKADFFDLNRSAAGVPDLGLRLTNFVTAYNLNYKFDMKPWWLEPTVGFSYTSTMRDGASKSLGFEDGHTVRVQGGIRAGTSYDWNGVTVEPTLTAMAYSDVEMPGTADSCTQSAQARLLLSGMTQ